MEGLLRRIRFPVRQSPDRSGMPGETIEGFSGREKASSTGHRTANPSSMLRFHRQAISIKPIHMTFPGIGHIDIRRPLCLPTGRM
jgi:hypothetical protein